MKTYESYVSLFVCFHSGILAKLILNFLKILEVYSSETSVGIRPSACQFTVHLDCLLFLMAGVLPHSFPLFIYSRAVLFFSFFLAEVSGLD